MISLVPRVHELRSRFSLVRLSHEKFRALLSHEQREPDNRAPSKPVVGLLGWERMANSESWFLRRQLDHRAIGGSAASVSRGVEVARLVEYHPSQGGLAIGAIEVDENRLGPIRG